MGLLRDREDNKNKHNFVLKVFGVQNDCFSFASTFFVDVNFYSAYSTVATFITVTCMTAIANLVSCVVIFCLLFVFCLILP